MPIYLYVPMNCFTLLIAKANAEKGLLIMESMEQQYSTSFSSQTIQQGNTHTLKTFALEISSSFIDKIMLRDVNNLHTQLIYEPTFEK